jgi:ectoine hydrolase
MTASATTEPTVIFERNEYLARLAKVKAKMSQAGLDVLLVTDPVNIFYLSGYEAWSFYVTQALLVVIDQEEPIWLGRKLDVNGAKLTAFVKEENLIGYPDDYVQSATKHAMQFIGDVIKERKWDKRTVGLELDSYYATVQGYQALTRTLPHTTFKDSSLLVNWVRGIKSEQELTYMKQAAKIAENAMNAAIDKVAIGVRECDVAAQIYSAQMTGTQDYGGNYTSSIPFMPSGKRSSAPHLSWTSERYPEGTIIPIELNGCRYRYNTPMSRTVVLGSAPSAVSEVAEIVLEGLQAAIDAVRPGVLAEEVELAWRKVIAKHGIIKESRLGYSIGLSYPPTTNERTISLRPGDKTVLEPNMTLHIIPGIWRDDWGVVISEAVYVTEQDCKTFCDFPRALVVKEAKR